ncbi:DUF6691 family protein [Roseivirga sp. BDSF3-8]|uniref:DUF6691 family protein n=1 Tax=Roseivirga sp. BDSF3-8 TaxID=3241598 RepID=UPI0035319B4A
MKYIKYILAGAVFGIILAKAEVISWYRIYEMFRFDNFHMFGVIGSAIAVGVIGIQFIKRTGMKDMNGQVITFNDKDKSVPRYLIGGIIFGLGWALVGACPGPMFILAGFGYASIFLVIFGALAGTALYGFLRHKLPH